MGLEDLRERPPGDGQVLPPILEQNIRFTLSKRCVCVSLFSSLILITMIEIIGLQRHKQRDAVSENRTQRGC